MLPRALVTLAVLLTIASLSPARAAEVPSTLADDLRKAQLVVAGTVESGTAQVGFELFELRVDEVVAGVARGPRLVIVSAGGAVAGQEGLRRRLSSEAYYQPGEPVIVLLTAELPAHLRRPHIEGRGYYYTVRKLTARDPAERAGHLEAIRRLLGLERTGPKR